MTWRVAESLVQLRKQIDVSAPQRNKSSDGTIGDTHHASRSSDHNPWVKFNGMGIVTALDITHDPHNGVDCHKLANALKQSADARLKYIIWCEQIWNPDKSAHWRKYTGANPHTKHMHISVRPEPKFFDNLSEWMLGSVKPDLSIPKIVSKPLLKQDSTGEDVVVMKDKLIASITAMLRNEGDNYGVATKIFVEAFQKSVGLGADGKVGAYTWEKLK